MALTILSGIDDELLAMLRESFTTNEQQLFVQSFQMYLQHGDDDTAFVVNLNDIWQWMGFSTMASAKRVLVKKFTPDVDYKIMLNQNVEQAWGGHNKETVAMTVKTFKKFCMKASTPKAEEVCDYYVDMENIMMKYTKNKMLNSRAQVANLEHSLMYERHNALIQGNDKKKLVYVMKLETFPDGSFIIKIGKSMDVRGRVQSLSAEIGAQAIVMDLFPCEKFHEFEQFLHNHSRLTAIKYTDMVRGRMTSTETYKVKSQAEYGCIKRLIEREIYKYRDEDVEKQRLAIWNHLMHMCDYNYKRYIKMWRLMQRPASTPIIINYDGIEGYHMLMTKLGKNTPTQHEPKDDNDTQDDDTDDDDEDDSEDDEYVNNTQDTSTDKDIHYKAEGGATTSTTNPQFQPKTTALTGPRVQQYDATDHTKLLRVFDGITEVTREIPNTSYTALKFAARNRLAYVGFRWHLLDRADPTYNQPKPIGATRDSKTKKVGVVAMVNLDRTHIIKLFSTQKDAAQHVSQEASAICVAIKFTRQLSGYYWYMYEDLDQTMKDAYLKDNKVPDVLKTCRGVKVQQINPETNAVVKEYKSITEVCKECAMSPKKVKEIATCEGIFKGFRWKFAR